MEEVKKAFQDLGLVHFLHEREYLWPSAFPSNDDNKCPASLLKKHILYEGENSERVKVMLENIIDEYSAGNLLQTQTKLVLNLIRFWTFFYR